MIKVSKRKKAQLTIFIVIALVILAVVGSVFLWVYRDKIGANFGGAIDIKSSIEECINQELINAEKEIFQDNGYYNLSSNYYLYYGEKVPFLCASSQFYKPCINQEPNFMGHISNEMTVRMNASLKQCLQEAKSLLEKNGYSVKLENESYSFEIGLTKLTASIEGAISAEKNEDKRIYRGFSSSINSPLLEVVNSVTSVVNFESALCEFNDITWMKYHGAIGILKFVGGDGVKVYTVTDKDSEKAIKFAVSTCILPGGI